MRILVTGASGHVGGNLVRALLARGDDVRVMVHRDTRALDGLAVEQVQADLCDPASLRRACDGVEMVYHVAALISLRMQDWPLLERVNVQGTWHVVNACLDAGVRRLVHFSSIEAFSPEPHDEVIDESRAPADHPGVSSYAQSKAAAEKVVREGLQRGLDAVIVNPTAIFGPYDIKPSHFGQALLALALGRLPALVDSGFNWVSADDVVMGAIAAAERAPAGSQYLLGGEWAHLRRVAALAETITGTPPPRIVVPLWLARIGAPFAVAYAGLANQRPLYTAVSLMALSGYRHVSHEKAARELGYQPRPLFDTLYDTYRWFEEAGYLDRPLVYTRPEDSLCQNSASLTVSSPVGSRLRQ